MLCLLLIATTGFILAAMDAGIIPDSTPSMTQIVKASVIMSGEMIIGNGKTPLKASASNPTINSPIKPPMMQKECTFE